MNVKIYETETKKLFDEWKKEATHSPFVTDGVMRPEQWFSQDVRPLFLLKEAYGGDCDWDLAKDHVIPMQKQDRFGNGFLYGQKAFGKPKVFIWNPLTPIRKILKISIIHI